MKWSSKTGKFEINQRAEDHVRTNCHKKSSKSHPWRFWKASQKNNFQEQFRYICSCFQIEKSLDNISRSFLLLSSTIPVTDCYQNSMISMLSAIAFNVRKNVCIGGKRIILTYLTDKSNFFFVTFLGPLCVIAVIKSLVCTVNQLCYKGNVNITHSLQKSRVHNELSVMNV